MKWVMLDMKNVNNSVATMSGSPEIPMLFCNQSRMIKCHK